MDIRQKIKDFISPVDEEELLELNEEESLKISEYEQPQNKAAEAIQLLRLSTKWGISRESKYSIFIFGL